MRAHRRNTISVHGRYHSSAPPYNEIQEQLGTEKVLRAAPGTAAPLLTLLIQLNDKNYDKDKVSARLTTIFHGRPPPAN